MRKIKLTLVMLLGLGCLGLADIALGQYGGGNGRQRGFQSDQQMQPRQRQGRGMMNRFQGRWGQVNPEELMNFLRQYVPDLAERLAKLQQNDPARFDREIVVVGRLYGPVMRQMQVDPAMGKLSVERIRLEMQIKKLVGPVKAHKDPESRKRAEKDLRPLVGQLFDVILAQQKRRLDQWGNRLRALSEGDGPGGPMPMMGRGRGQGRGRGPARNMGPESGPPMAPGRGRGMGMGRGRGRGASQQLQLRLEERRKQIDTWTEQKEQIVKARIQELLQGIEPFPWAGN